MKTLLIIAHGSRREESNKEIAALADSITKISQDYFKIISHAFLEFTDPSADYQIEKLAGLGASEIIVFPFFLASGNHVIKDLPEILKSAEEKYPHITFKQTPHLGRIDGLKNLILDQVRLL
ncbi:MAG: CbiX/SirB N-terminal domain-containing protein [Desulfobacterales bacterium]|nr:CbiX/SirB N-terminal domain-containing protein [Desulfobacterales bacterium]